VAYQEFVKVACYLYAINAYAYYAYLLLMHMACYLCYMTDGSSSTFLSASPLYFHFFSPFCLHCPEAEHVLHM